jgi:hypothetical protein
MSRQLVWLVNKLGKSVLLLLCILLAIQDELVDSRAEVKSFDKSSLKHVDTVEKNALPDAGSMFIDNNKLCKFQN